MEIKLVATDMDGTFLDENHQFDQALLMGTHPCNSNYFCLLSSPTIRHNTSLA